MTKEGLVEDAKNKLADAAKVGAQGVKAVGREALTAAATAAAGVVLDRVSQALGAGQQKAEEAIPQMEARSPDQDQMARRPARGVAPKKAQAARSSTKSSQRKKAVSKKTRTAKQRGKSAGAKKAVATKAATRKKAGRKNPASRSR